MTRFKRSLLYIHQLPQHIIGYGCFLFFDVRKRIRLARCVDTDALVYCYYVKGIDAGFSLGKYTFLPESDAMNHTTRNERHEYGHSRQSMRLGWLYLIVIAIPSVCGNIYDRIFKKSSEWYYNLPWEKWADRLGGVRR